MAGSLYARLEVISDQDIAQRYQAIVSVDHAAKPHENFPSNADAAVLNSAGYRCRGLCVPAPSSMYGLDRFRLSVDAFSRTVPVRLTTVGSRAQAPAHEIFS